MNQQPGIDVESLNLTRHYFETPGEKKKQQIRDGKIGRATAQSDNEARGGPRRCGWLVTNTWSQGHTLPHRHFRQMRSELAAQEDGSQVCTLSSTCPTGRHKAPTPVALFEGGWSDSSGHGPSRTRGTRTFFPTARGVNLEEVVTSEADCLSNSVNKPSSPLLQFRDRSIPRDPLELLFNHPPRISDRS